jgi:hypothetical protein
VGCDESDGDDDDEDGWFGTTDLFDADEWRAGVTSRARSHQSSSSSAGRKPKGR